MGRLNGKVAIVTGAARGIGAAIARKLAAEGAKVVLTDLLDTDGTAEAAHIGASALYLHHDVSRAGDWASIVSDAEKAFGPVDILVNNAGILGTPALLEATTEEDFDRVLTVNLKSVFLGMKAVFPSMKRHRRGAIVNISSVAGIVTTPQMAAYTASKFAVRGITKTAALEGGAFGIRVNSVHPGYTDTQMIAGMIPPDHAEEFKRNASPLGRLGRPEDIADMVAFLASDESAFSTAGEFVADGGYLAQ